MRNSSEIVRIFLRSVFAWLRAIYKKQAFIDIDIGYDIDIVYNIGYSRESASERLA